MSTTETVLETEQLTREFGDITAVCDLDLSVHEGEIYGFLGPNGAGKTTTIHMLLSLVRPTAGRIWLFGEKLDPEDATPRRRIGVLPGHGELYDNLTATEHIEFATRIKETDDDPVALCQRVGLDSAAGQTVSGFSTGMRQRLKLAMALVGEPDLLILDEPTSGLDPNGARQMRNIIEAENERGATVFFSSHVLGQVEQTCDRVGILDDGRLIAEDTISGLRSQVGGKKSVRVRFSEAIRGVADRFRDMEGVSSITVDGRTLELDVGDATRINEIVRKLDRTEAGIESISTEEGSLEDLFAAYTEEAGNA
jgi:ABC-2 type transport system ATP-binding protein